MSVKTDIEQLEDAIFYKKRERKEITQTINRMKKQIEELKLVDPAQTRIE